MIAYLREVDAGTNNACWIVCNKVDPDAVLFVSDPERQYYLGAKRIFRWLGRRDGYRWSVRWLAARALEMNDPHARDVLHSAATNLGWAGAKLHKKDPYKDPLTSIVTEDMAKAAYEARKFQISIPKLGMRTLTWAELPQEIKDEWFDIVRAAIGAGI